MSSPVGRREFFALEAGEYLERLALLVDSDDVPEADELVRHARALRGAALLAGPPGFSVAAAAIEATTKAVREGTLPWSPLLAERLAGAVEDCKALLRRVREWSETDSRRCERIAEQLEAAPGSGRRRHASAAGGETGLTAGVRAYVAREAAAVAGTLDQVAETVERRPARDSADPLVHRLQPLRGLGALPGLSPLPELLETLDLALTAGSRNGAWSPLAGKALRAVGAALARMARDIAELGIPQHDSTEVVQAVESLRGAFLLEDDVVEVTTLAPAGERSPIVTRGVPPVAQVAAGDVAIELVSLADRLRQAADQTRGHVNRSARTLQLQGLVLALRGLGLTPAVHAGTADLLVRIDREAMSGRALTRPDHFASILRRSADQLALAADQGRVAELPASLAGLLEELDRMGGADSETTLTIVPVEALAPAEEEAGVVPIESLLYDAVPAAAPGYLPFEQTFSTYFRMSREQDAGQPVPIETLLYRGRRALLRADEVRRRLGATLGTSHDQGGVDALVAELLDLVPLALDDDR